ncbi:MAG: DinB family protein [Reichenbachiella sp.]|uniref:DinB family protein n=1 Tax=Reichenbachiella sp. TaxID=2184521 RepID=UPI003263B888
MEIKPAVYRIFDQLIHVLENLSNDEYSRASVVLHHNSIGQHMRHTLEFFVCLLDGMASGRINYDERERDIFLESNTLEALSAIVEIKKRLEPLKKNIELELVSNIGDESSQPLTVATNLDRELLYNLEHAVHHMALIKIGLNEVNPALELPEDFGVASSTVKYRQSLKASI